MQWLTSHFSFIPSISLRSCDSQGKLNVYEVDSFKETLRLALHEEKALLLEDIDYLTSLLDKETDTQVSSRNHRVTFDREAIQKPAHVLLTVCM